MVPRGSVFKRGKSWYWKVDVGTSPEGRRIQKKKGGYRTRAEAGRALNRVLAQVADGTWQVPVKDTLGQYLLEDWLPGKKPSVRPTTWEGYRWLVESYVVPHIGSLLLTSLRPPTFQKLYAQLLEDGGRRSKGLSPASVGAVHRVLRVALTDAVSWGLLSSHPMAGVRPPRDDSDQEPLRFWTPSELARFLKSTEGTRLFPLWRLLAYTGLRRGEALGLHWDDVDFEEQRLQVRHSLKYVRSQGLHLGPPKTRAGRRTVVLDDSTARILQAHRARQAQERLSAGAAWEDTGLVFTRPTGAPLHPSWVTDAFRSAQRHVGVPEIRLHDLRHTHATVLIGRGIHPKAVQERLGHTNIAETMDTYTHVLPDAQSAVRAALQ